MDAIGWQHGQCRCAILSVKRVEGAQTRDLETRGQTYGVDAGTTPQARFAQGSLEAPPNKGVMAAAASLGTGKRPRSLRAA